MIASGSTSGYERQQRQAARRPQLMGMWPSDHRLASGPSQTGIKSAAKAGRPRASSRGCTRPRCRVRRRTAACFSMLGKQSKICAENSAKKKALYFAGRISCQKCATLPVSCAGHNHRIQQPNLLHRNPSRSSASLQLVEIGGLTLPPTRQLWP